VLLNKRNSYGYARTSNYSRSSPYTETVTPESKLGNDKKNEVSAVSSTGSGTGQSQIVESGRNRSGEFKHLTGAEMREKRENGLCFRCDEPFTREHKCKNK